MAKMLASTLTITLLPFNQDVPFPTVTHVQNTTGETGQVFAGQKNTEQGKLCMYLGVYQHSSVYIYIDCTSVFTISNSVSIHMNIRVHPVAVFIRLYPYLAICFHVSDSRKQRSINI